ncbi:MAG: carbohydrate kinase family protein [Armatimonadota bacterium]
MYRGGPVLTRESTRCAENAGQSGPRRDAIAIAADRVPSFDVIALGGVCWDLLGIIPFYPGLDEKVAMSELSQQGGGQAGTGIATVARLGGRAAIFARIGGDDFGRHIRRTFEEEGVDTTWLVEVPDATSQFAFCAIDEKTGKRTIFYIHGTKGKFAPEDLDREALLDCRCLLVDGHHNVAAAAAVRWAREAGLPVVLDLERPQAQDEMLVANASHPIVPERYALQLTGEEHIEQAGRAMLERGPEVVVVTRGPGGSVAFTDNEVIREPAIPVEPIVDTTGAGDVFHGAFAYGIALGYDLRENLRFSSAVAAIKCRSLGGRAGIPTMPQVREFLQSH